MYSDALQWTRVRRQVLTGVMSQREVAREHSIARSTVRKMVQISAPPGYCRENPIRRPKLGPWLELIDEIVKEDAGKPAKQQRTAREVWKWLKSTAEFRGAYTIVKDYVRERRRKLAARTRNHYSHASDSTLSDPLFKSEDPAHITYLLIQSLPKREAIKLLGSLFAGEQPQLDCKQLDQMFVRFAAKEKKAIEADRKEPAAFCWMWKIIQGQMTVERLAEEIGERPDLGELLHAVTEGKLSLRNRALAILGKEKGFSIRIVANVLHMSRITVVKCCRSYSESGWKSLTIKKKSSNAKSNIDTNKQAIFSLLHSPPSAHGFNRTTWRMIDLQDVLRRQGASMCKDVIHTIIKEAGYRWRRARVVLTSRDPEYRTKVAAIEKILSMLGQDEAFFSIDEYGPFAVKHKGGTKRVARGENYVVQQWQKSKGWMILTAALELSRNQVTHFYSFKKNTDEMIKMADLLRSQYSSCSTIYLSWDAASWHISKKLVAHLEKVNKKAARDGCPVVKTAPLPSGAQFLNVIESVFSGMARAIIHNSDYPSVEAARSGIDRYFAERNLHFLQHAKRAGKKIWGRERVPSEFQESQNCKDPRYQ
jgi:transposase